MDDLLINFGGGIEVKSVGDGLTELRGPSIVFDTHEGGGSDLAQEYFAADTYFGPGVTLGKTAEFEATFNHGIPTQEGLKALTDYEFKNPVKTEVTDAGVIASLLLDEREEYEKMLAEFARKNPGKLGWSTATAAHRAKREKKSDGRAWIKRWPIVEIAVTHKPCEPRTSATTALKSYAESEAKAIDGNALFNESLRQTEQQIWELWSALQTGTRKIAEGAAASSVTGVEVDVRAALASLVGAFNPRFVDSAAAQIDEWLKSENREEHFYLKSQFDALIASTDALVSDAKLEEHSAVVVSAVEEFAQKTTALCSSLKTWIKRVDDKQEFRTNDPLKAGRVISQANKEKVGSVRTRLSELVSMMADMQEALDELLAMAEPKKAVPFAFNLAIAEHLNWRAQHR